MAHQASGCCFATHSLSKHIRTFAHMHTHWCTNIHCCLLLQINSAVPWICHILLFLYFYFWFGFGDKLFLLIVLSLLLYLVIFLCPLLIFRVDTISSGRSDLIFWVLFCALVLLSLGHSPVVTFNILSGSDFGTCLLINWPDHKFTGITDLFIHSFLPSFIQQVFECLQHARYWSRCCFTCISRPCT